MHFFAPLQWDGECFFTVLHILIQRYLTPAGFVRYRASGHVPHPGHTTQVMDEVALAVIRFNGTWRPGLFSGAGHGPSF